MNLNDLPVGRSRVRFVGGAIVAVTAPPPDERIRIKVRFVGGVPVEIMNVEEVQS
jgi:hypothetical protein